MTGKTTEMVLSLIREVGVIKFGSVMVAVIGTLLGGTWGAAVWWTTQADPAQVRINSARISELSDSVQIGDDRLSSRLMTLESTAVSRDEFASVALDLTVVRGQLDRLLCRLDGGTAEACERNGRDGP